MLSEAIIEKFGRKEGFTTIDGKIAEWPYTEPKPSDAEIAALVADYKRRNDYKINRALEYPHVDDLIVALWERAVEGRPASSDAIQAIRAAIKVKYPKPV